MATKDNDNMNKSSDVGSQANESGTSAGSNKTSGALNKQQGASTTGKNKPIEVPGIEKTRISIPDTADSTLVSPEVKASHASDASRYEDGTILQANDTSEPPPESDTVVTLAGHDAQAVQKEKRKIILKERFELLSVIGSGGMGTVYKALDLRKLEAKDLEPYVALKVLGKALKNHPYAFVALQREAKKSQKLAHPNILTVHDFDRDGDITFMTMELLEGESLDKFLFQYKGVGVPYKKAIKIIRDFCAALEYAHQHSIIHLDFKPGNIFVTPNNTKVLDFGIARITKDKKDPKDFDAGAFSALTPTYASLEMLQGQDPDPRDDVFAAAMICYELLSGQHPFNRKSADKAYAEKLKPKRIKSLAKRQWKALEHALAFERKTRTPSVKQFITEFTSVKQRHFMQAAAILLLTVAGGWFAYNRYFAPDKLSIVVANTMAKAGQCYDAKDFLCAVENAQAVLKIKPGDAAANQLLMRAQQAQHQSEVDAIVSQAERCFTSEDLQCVLNNVDRLVEKDPANQNIQRLRQQVQDKKQQQLIETTLTKADDCLKNEDFQCALSKSEDVLAQQPQHKAALRIKSTAQKHMAQIRQHAKQLADLIQHKLHRANNCYAAKNYNCTLENADAVLEYEPGNQNALSIKQKVAFAMQVIEENQVRVGKILEKGKECFNRKDYSCAIAKSESALEIIPDSDAALTLKKEAKEAIQKLKASITIQ